MLALPSALAAALLVAVRIAPAQDERQDDPRWWRGNTHTHTLWSDGDAPPDFVAKQYREAGYHFLVLSDHNVLSRGERWMPIEAGGRVTPARLVRLREELGPDAVRTRTTEAGEELWLATLEDVREEFGEEGRFLLIEGEEITDSFEGRPVHVNGINLSELIDPQGGKTFLDTVQRNVDAVRAQSERTGRAMLAHLNHPNFGWAVREPGDLVGLEGEGFLEVYNGHPSTREAGDEEHLSVEALWDEVNLRRSLMGQPLLLGFATDDSHHHFDVAPNRSNMLRGWVMVRAPRLEAEALVEAMRAGDFYATSGVLLEDVSFVDGTLTVDVDAREDVTYETRFVGAVLDEDETWTVRVLQSTTADPAVYAATGDELFVRATVVSSRPHPRPQDEPPGVDEVEMAWTQPVRLRR